MPPKDDAIEKLKKELNELELEKEKVPEEQPKEQEVSFEDVIKDIYAKIIEIEKQMESLRLNQIYLQNFINNALKTLKIEKE